MEAKLARQEESVARFASIALLHLSMDKKRQKMQQQQLRKRAAPLLGDGLQDDTQLSTDAPTITLPQLIELRKAFDNLDGGDGALSEDAFVEEFHRVGCRLSEAHLRWWFRRIDADDSGSVDWHELSSFIIAGSVDESGRIVANAERPEDAMFAKDEKGVSVPPTEASPNAVAGFNHSDFVTAVYCHPRIGKYFTASQDGTVRVWDAQTMEFEYILHQGKWVTSMCASQDDTKLFVAGLDRTIFLFEFGNLQKAPRCYVGNILDENHRVPKGRPIHRFEIQSRHLADPAASGGSGFRPGETLEEFRLRNERIRHTRIADQTVEAHILRQMEFPANVMACVPDSEVLLMGLTSGRIQGYPLVHRSLLKGRFIDCVLDVNPHEAFPVTTLMYADFFDGFLSTAADGSVALTNVRSRVVTKVGVAATPIYHAVWMEGPRLLATCGASRDISLWSASPQTSTMTLTGHYCSVVQLAFDANDNWLISVDADRMIVVWNMHNMQPIQTVTDYDTYQLRRFSCMHYDARRNRIICASTAPVIFTKGATTVPLADPSYKGHQRPLVGCLYNRVFHQVITADSECIKLWEASNGEMRACVSVASLRQTGVPTKFAGGGNILGIRQDANHRRLIVALSSATVCVMSISNCHLVLECHRASTKMLTTVDAGGTFFIPLPSSRVGKRGFGLIVGTKILLWEDKDTVSNIGVGREIHFHMHQTYYEMLSRQQQTPVPQAARQHWRCPHPLCAGSAEALIYVGTDCGIVMVYGTTTSDPYGFLGVFDHTVSVTCVGWHDASTSIVYALSNGRVMFAHAQHRNKHIAVAHQDDGGVPVSILCFEVALGHLVAGDDEGTVHTWSLTAIDYDAVRPFTTQLVSRDVGASVCEYIASFRAHMSEVSSIALLPARDASGGDVVRVVTSSSDCQCRIFTLNGLFVGYVGAPWTPSASHPRSALRSVPAPIQDLKTSRSFLRHYLPGMPSEQLPEPDQEDLVPDTRPQLLQTFASPNRSPTELSSTVVVSPTHGILPSLHTSAINTNQAMPLSPNCVSPRGGGRVTGKSIREDAARSVRSDPSERTTHHIPSPPSPRRPQALLGKPKVRSTRKPDEENALLQAGVVTSLAKAAHQASTASGVSASTLCSHEAFMQQLTTPVAISGCKGPAPPGLSLDALLQNAGAPSSTSKSSRRFRSIVLVDTVDEASNVQRPVAKGNTDEDEEAAQSWLQPDASVPFCGASSTKDAAHNVAALVPLLHLERVSEWKTAPPEKVDRAVVGRNSNHNPVTHTAYTARLNEWRSRHRQWTAEQCSTTDMIKTARPMSMVRVLQIDDALREGLLATTRASPSNATSHHH